jgi:hypothetical protein
MSARVEKVRECVNDSFPHAAEIHGHGMCQACLKYLRRHHRPRPPYLIMAELDRQTRVSLVKDRKQLAARHELLVARLARKAVTS